MLYQIAILSAVKMSWDALLKNFHIRGCLKRKIDLRVWIVVFQSSNRHLKPALCLMESGMKQVAEFGRPVGNTHPFQSLSTRGCSFLSQSHFLCELRAFTKHFFVTLRFFTLKNEEHYLGDTPEMKCSSGIVIVLVFMLGQTHGDSVKQMEGQVTLSEEASLTINCTFSTSTTPTLFWYVQYLGEGPQILLKALRDKEKGSNKGFEATLDSSSKSFHLKKGSVQMSDSAVYYCALSDTVMGTAWGAEHKLRVEQGPGC
uniref:Ig-like domain-containing protein n=2 Tax=Canis lupus familiaris TaxID=9615 RepID=A0A8C0SAY2_CANLF